MKILVMGCGAMGSIYAGLLAAGGNEVVAVDTWREHVAAMRDRGLRVEGASGDRVVKVRALEQVPDEAMDLVVVAVKAAHVAEAAGRLTARDPRPLVLITAMFARKDSLGFFQPFAELKPQVLATTFDSPNAAPADEIAQAAREAGLEAETVADVEQGLRRALAGTGPAPHVLICGGLHFAGEVLAMSPETWPT